MYVNGELYYTHNGSVSQSKNEFALNNIQVGIYEPKVKIPFVAGKNEIKIVVTHRQDDAWVISALDYFKFTKVQQAETMSAEGSGYTTKAKATITTNPITNSYEIDVPADMETYLYWSGAANLGFDTNGEYLGNMKIKIDEGEALTLNKENTVRGDSMGDVKGIATYRYKLSDKIGLTNESFVKEEKSKPYGTPAGTDCISFYSSGYSGIIVFSYRPIHFCDCEIVLQI